MASLRLTLAQVQVRFADARRLVGTTTDGHLHVWDVVNGIEVRPGFDAQYHKGRAERRAVSVGSRLVKLT